MGMEAGVIPTQAFVSERDIARTGLHVVYGRMPSCKRLSYGLDQCLSRWQFGDASRMEALT